MYTLECEYNKYTLLKIRQGYWVMGPYVHVHGFTV